MRDILGDPVYLNGVQAESINVMLDDISQAASGRLHHVRVPQPVNGIAPTQAIHYKTPADMYVKDLHIKSTKASRAALSRRSMAYAMSNSAQVNPLYHYKTDVHVPDDDVNIDDVIRMVTSSRISDDEDDDHSVVPSTHSERSNTQSIRYARRRRRVSNLVE
jgi:hypothetical protein